MEQNEKNDVLNKAYENFKVVNDGFKNMIDEFNDVFAERRFLRNEIYWNQNGLESFDILHSQMDEFIKRLVSIDDKQSPAVTEFQKIHTAIKNYIFSKTIPKCSNKQASSFILCCWRCVNLQRRPPPYRERKCIL